jgi:non-homologous end joining protein Ku
VAGQLVDSLSAEAFDPTHWRDHSRETLEALIDARLTGRQPAVPATRRIEEPIDLLEALDQARRTRADG